jgi:hypothetical protein
MPPGRSRERLPRPIDAERVTRLYKALGAQFDYILVQQGAVVNDTRYLVCAAKADLILVLVEEGLTPVNELDRCLEVFRSHQITGYRVVLCEAK